MTGSCERVEGLSYDMVPCISVIACQPAGFATFYESEEFPLNVHCRSPEMVRLPAMPGASAAAPAPAAGVENGREYHVMKQ